MRSLTRSFHSVVLILVCCLSPLCLSQQRESLESNHSIQPYLETLKSGRNCPRRAAIVALHQMGKTAIPLLIDHINDSDVAPSSTLMLANPILSSAPASQKDELSGVINAYVVELILASETLRDEKDCTFLLSEGDYAYGWGVIMKDGEVISATDLAPVKQQYLQWWGKNHNKSLSTLRVEWKKRIRPLTGSEYHWR
jgi:hypothetical protein